MPIRLLVVVALVAAACNGAEAETTTTTSSRLTGESARATLVLDGDSFEAVVDGQSDEVRMLGINAPEGDECFGDEARDGLISQIDGEELILVRGSDDDRDQFGRLLRYVYVPSRETVANEVMLFDGLAIVLQSDHELDDLYYDVNEDAAFRRAGLWDPEACGPSQDQDIQIEWVEWDPPGDDSEALNDEYVEIVHHGDQTVDLTGWVVRDESSSNRYVFERSFAPGDHIFLRTGCGEDEGEDLYWCADQPVWSNVGDTAMLLDTHGNVVAWFTFRGRP